MARSANGFGLTALRVVTGGLLASHGIQKLTGKLGGGGLDRTAAGFSAMGLHPGRRNAIVAGTTEMASGLGLLLGAVTPAAAAGLSGTMTVAITKVHGPRGMWVSKGGAEYNVTLMAVAFALAAMGPGRLAVDGWLLRRRAGLGWAVGQLAAGAGVAAAVLTQAKRSTPAPEPQPAAEGAA